MADAEDPRGHEGGRFLEIGSVVKAHGLAGETVVSLVTNVADRLAPGSRFRATGKPLQPESPRELVVRTSRPFQHRHLVRFEGITTREEAEALRGLRLVAEAVDDPESLFVHELIGAEVFDTVGTGHGRVVAIEANPASDLLVGEPGWLLPLRFVVERGPGRLVVDVPEGLFD